MEVYDGCMTCLELGMWSEAERRQRATYQVPRHGYDFVSHPLYIGDFSI